MTFYGYTEEERKGRFDDASRNIYEQKAERLRDRQFWNYAYGLAGPFEMEHRFLTMKDCEIISCPQKNDARHLNDLLDDGWVIKQISGMPEGNCSWCWLLLEK